MTHGMVAQAAYADIAVRLLAHSGIDIWAKMLHN